MITKNYKTKEQKTVRLAKYYNREKESIFSLAYNNIFIKFLFIFLIIINFTGCASYKSTNTNNSNEGVVISEMTTNQTALSKSDVAKYFCNNLTEYFNTYKYYKIFSEVYNEKEKQNRNSTTMITKNEKIYNVKYIGSAGWYAISFSNSKFKGAEEIYTFGRLTILGNAIRSKVYDTFSAWLNREEIALKAYNNSHLYINEIIAAVEVENWYNSLSTNEE